MRLVIQRASSGSVSVNNSLVSSIGPGIVCLVGLHGEREKSILLLSPSLTPFLSLLQPRTLRGTASTCASEVPTMGASAKKTQRRPWTCCAAASLSRRARIAGVLSLSLNALPPPYP
jgi:hypothetical protein